MSVAAGLYDHHSRAVEFLLGITFVDCVWKVRLGRGLLRSFSGFVCVSERRNAGEDQADAC